MTPFIQSSYRKPPVVETVLGVQFEPIKGLTTAHLGAFWKALGAEWPNVAEVAPLEPAFERFGNEIRWETLGFRFRVGVMGSRLQIKTADADRMVQVQNGRLYYNWLHASGGNYPRYRPTLKPGFDDTLHRFQSFLEGEGLGALQPNQWEITYVNRLIKGQVWETPADWFSLVGGFMPMGNLHEAVKLESGGGEWHFEIQPQRGRLHLQLQHGRADSEDGPETLTMKLTARGPVQADNPAMSVDAGIELGHDVIVDTFKRLTSGAAHDFWEEDR